VWEYLKEVLKRRGAGYFVLIDPDKHTRKSLKKLVDGARDADVDAFLVGGSYIFSDMLDKAVRMIKDSVNTPVILFPGAGSHLSRYADGLLFLSLVSGRNPQFLIEEQVRAAPIVKRIGLEAVPTGYIMIGGGNETTVEFMTGTRPIPAGKTDLAVAHALAAEYLGMKLLYLESGSGASQPISDEMISAVKKHCGLPIIVGGGITTPEAAAQKVRAGADFILTGNVLENPENIRLIKSFAQAVHTAA
jgi:phosphoglycerol geranylgeranyltransferase